MTYFKYMRRIILPQAVRVIVPPLGNEFNAMLKNTTLVSVIGVPELLLATQMITSATFRVFELYTVVADEAAGGTTVLLVEQYAEKALDIAHAAAVMAGGRIVASGPPAEIKDRLEELYLGGAA